VEQHFNRARWLLMSNELSTTKSPNLPYSPNARIQTRRHARLKPITASSAPIFARCLHTNISTQYKPSHFLTTPLTYLISTHRSPIPNPVTMFPVLLNSAMPLEDYVSQEANSFIINELFGSEGNMELLGAYMNHYTRQCTGNRRNIDYNEIAFQLICHPDIRILAYRFTSDHRQGDEQDAVFLACRLLTMVNVPFLQLSGRSNLERGHSGAIFAQGIPAKCAIGVRD
jgi:hypothetical protein